VKRLGRRLAKWRRTRRLAVAVFGWLVVLFVGIAFVGWHELSDLAEVIEEAERIRAANERSHALHALEMQLRAFNARVHAFHMSGNPEDAARIRQELAALDARARAMVQQHALPEQALDDALARMQRAVQALLQLARPTADMEAPLYVAEVDQAVEAMAVSIGRVHRKLDRAVDRAMRRIAAVQLDMRGDFALGLLALLVGFGLFAVFLQHRLLRPLLRLTAIVRRIEAGDLSVRVSSVQNDEIGVLGKAIERMAQALAADRARRAQAQAAEAHADKMRVLGLLSAGLAHEVGNKLAGAMAQAQLAHRRFVHGDAQVASALQATLEELGRMEEVIRAVLAFAREESDATACDPQQVIQQAIRLVAFGARRKHVRFELVAQGAARCQCPASVLQQVLVNLLLNALDASSQDATIRIEVQLRDDAVWIDVEDEGGGVSPQAREHLFELGYSTKQAHGGLGLAISRELMRAYGGDLLLVEAKAGRGARFRIEAPRLAGGG